MTIIKGIDVHGGKGAIDWARVAQAENSFAFLKASEGKTLKDGRFRPNALEATAAGLLVGAYHFARPDNNDAQEDAANFLEAIKDVPLTLPCVLDLERRGSRDKESLTAWCLVWLETVRKATGKAPLIYLNVDFIRRKVDAPALTDYGLWIVDLSSRTVPRFAPWSNWQVRQCSWWGTVPGVDGKVDLDTFNGTHEQLRALGG